MVVAMAISVVRVMVMSGFCARGFQKIRHVCTAWRNFGSLRPVFFYPWLFLRQVYSSFDFFPHEPTSVAVFDCAGCRSKRRSCGGKE